MNINVKKVALCSFKSKKDNNIYTKFILFDTQKKLVKWDKILLKKTDIEYKLGDYID